MESSFLRKTDADGIRRERFVGQPLLRNEQASADIDIQIVKREKKLDYGNQA